MRVTRARTDPPACMTPLSEKPPRPPRTSLQTSLPRAATAKRLAGPVLTVRCRPSLGPACRVSDVHRQRFSLPSISSRLRRSETSSCRFPFKPAFTRLSHVKFDFFFFCLLFFLSFFFGCVLGGSRRLWSLNVCSVPISAGSLQTQTTGLTKPDNFPSNS